MPGRLTNRLAKSRTNRSCHPWPGWRRDCEPCRTGTGPHHPAEVDDGLLTASEVARLKLNANWVALSACIRAAGEKFGAEALSGLDSSIRRRPHWSYRAGGWSLNPTCV